jgi:hypothetical protein
LKESAPTTFSSVCQEVMITDPVTGGKKGQKEIRLDLLPVDTLWELARHYGRNTVKYEARNWERGSAWSLSYAALLRHLFAWWAGEDLDPMSAHKTRHLVAVAWHAIALLTFALRGIGTDDRPHKKTT